MSTAVLNQYTAHLDTKKRLTIRGALVEFFAVKVFSDGHVLLEPRVLVEPAGISKRTVRMMDQSVANLKKNRWKTVRSRLGWLRSSLDPAKWQGAVRDEWKSRA